MYLLITVIIIFSFFFINFILSKKKGERCNQNLKSHGRNKLIIAVNIAASASLWHHCQGKVSKLIIKCRLQFTKQAAVWGCFGLKLNFKCNLESYHLRLWVAMGLESFADKQLKTPLTTATCSQFLLCFFLGTLSFMNIK